MSSDRRLKVLWLCSWYPSKVDPFGGDFIQRHAEAVCPFVDVHVIHAVGDRMRSKSYASKVERLRGLNEWIFYYSTKRNFHNWIAPLKWIFYMWKLVSAYRSAFGEPDLVHVQVPYKSGLIARYLLWSSNVKYVVTEHWGIYNDLIADRFSSRSLLFRYITKFGYLKASLLVSVSDYQTRQLRRYIGELPSLTIRNVVDTSLFSFRQKEKSLFTFLHVSDWSENKNPQGIIHAFMELLIPHSDVRLILIGGKGDHFDKIQGLTIGLEEYITCLGEVSYGQVSHYMNLSDCLVLFSDSENSPCVIGEALCCGLQVIATDVGGVSELIDAECSQLIQPGSVQALRNAMINSIKFSDSIQPDEVASRAVNIFSKPVIGQSILAAYNRVLGVN